MLQSEPYLSDDKTALWARLNGPDTQNGTWPEFNRLIGGFFKFHWNDGQVTEWNPTFGPVMLELGVGVA